MTAKLSARWNKNRGSNPKIFRIVVDTETSGGYTPQGPEVCCSESATSDPAEMLSSGV
jgi:hypothetical protein